MARLLNYMSLALGLIMISNLPALAEEGSEATKQELAERYYELNPSWKIASAAIRSRAQNMEPQKRLVFITAMEKLISKKELREKSIPLIKELFSESELKALNRFYSDPKIRKALAKQETFMRRLSPYLTEMMDDAYMRYLTEQESPGRAR